VPGLGVDSAQQIIAEVGATAATFPSPKHLASWMGACPGNEESAGVNYSHRCPKGNRQMRRVLNQAANAAVKAKGTIFAVVYRRLIPRLGHAQAIGTITHGLCRLIWKILHQRIRYEERAGRQRTGETGAGAQDHPRTPQPRLPGRADLARSHGVSDFSTLVRPRRCLSRTTDSSSLTSAIPHVSIVRKCALSPDRIRGHNEQVSPIPGEQDR
jgi:hypothetical protein